MRDEEVRKKQSERKSIYPCPQNLNHPWVGMYDIFQTCASGCIFTCSRNLNNLMGVGSDVFPCRQRILPSSQCVAPEHRSFALPFEPDKEASPSILCIMVLST